MQHIAIGRELRLERALKWASLKVRSSPGEFTSLETLLGLLSNIKEAGPDIEVVLRQRAKVLSHLQCAHLDCMTPLCPWENNKPKLCSGCKLVRYCSAKCQKADWKEHKRACKLIAADK